VGWIRLWPFPFRTQTPCLTIRFQSTPLPNTPQRVWEVNSQGSIPYVPYLRAPFYVWVGRPWSDAATQLVHEQRVEAPPLFPPTFLYTQSWEDPEPDMKVHVCVGGGGGDWVIGRARVGWRLDGRRTLFETTANRPRRCRQRRNHRQPPPPPNAR
jgi:hypothetical protein